MILVLLGLVSRIPLGASPITVLLTIARFLLSLVAAIVFVRILASVLLAFLRA